MSRLRHPIRAIREPFGKAGLTVAIIALVFAMVGGAYAAGKLTTKQKKEVEKIAKKYAGKPGSPGAAGTAGTNGTNGKDGTNGTSGAAGKGVVVETVNTGVATECSKLGGTSFHPEGSASKSFACNGKEGKEGNPWTELGTLPEGATETGAWGTQSAGAGSIYVPVSLPLPMAVESPKLVVLKSDESNAECPGITAGVPSAEPGNICLYLSLGGGALSYIGLSFSPQGSIGAGPTGAVPVFECAGPGPCTIIATWAASE
jgi:hypothetical protein